MSYRNRKVYSVSRRLALLAGAAIIATVPGVVQAEEADQAAAGADRAASHSDDVIVTGTRIRGIAPVGAAVVSISQQAIQDTGTTGTTDLLRTVPQIANIGSDVGRTGSTAGGQTFNITQSSGINIRGLGTQATLVLIDGHRASPGGIFGNLFDPALIPTIALGNVEVLADGSSALYGSDAIAGVVNLGLRKNYDGIEVRGRYSFADGYDGWRVSGVAGHTWGTGQLMIAAEHSQNSVLAAAARPDLFLGVSAPFLQIAATAPNPVGYSSASAFPNFTVAGVPYAYNANGTLTANAKNVMSMWAGSNYLPAQSLNSVVGTFKQDITPTISFYAQGHYSHREYHDLYQRGTNGGAALFNAALAIPATNYYMAQVLAANGLTGATGPTSMSYLNNLGPNRVKGSVTNWLALGGLTAELPADFKLDVSVSTSRNHERRYTANSVNNAALPAARTATTQAAAYNPFGQMSSTVLAALLATNDQNFFYDLTVASAKADGPLFHIGGGDAKMAVGVEYAWHAEKFANISTIAAAPDANGTPVTQDTGRKMTIASAFGEFVLPLVGAENEMAGIRRLSLSVAARYDRYSVADCWVYKASAVAQGDPCSNANPTFDTFNPKIGLTWEAFNGFTVRASYGTSFRYNLVVSDPNGGPLNAAVSPYVDAVLGSTIAVRRGGGSTTLKPETAKTWTLGFDYKPEQVPGLELETTYFNVNYDNVIGTPDAIFAGNNAASSSQYAAYLIRRPSKLTPGADDTAFNALVSTVLTSSYYTTQAIVPNTPAGISSVNVFVEQRNQNIGKLKTSGLDFNFHYLFDLRSAKVLLGLTGTKYFTYKRAVAPGQPLIEVAGLIDNPTDYRLRGQIGLDTGAVRANLFLNYTPSYVNTYDTSGGIPTVLGSNGTNVSAQMTADLTVNFDIGAMTGSSLLKGVNAGVDIVNVLDSAPAYARVGSPIIQNFDSSTSNALGRIISFNLSKKF